MDFLNKIIKHFHTIGNKQFRKQVLEEKKQKYLFSDDFKDKYRSPRAGFFVRNKRVIAPFANIIWENFYRIKKKVLHSYLAAYVWIVLLVLSGYIIFFSPYFKISPSHVLLEARNDGIDIGLAYRTIEGIYGTSLFLLEEEYIALLLKGSLKNLAHITIDKLYPNGLKILMTSSPIIYNTQIHGYDRLWKMSDNWVLLPITSEAPDTSEMKQLEIISEELKAEVFFDYKQVIDDERMLLINKIIEIFESEWKDISIVKVRYFARENELHITLKNETHILLTLESESNSQNYADRIEAIKNQLLWLDTYITHNKDRIMEWLIFYIDARIIKKIFFCTQDEICKDNLIKIYGETYR